ncbi:MAG TPA: MFS transporter [Acidimicrobiales bacterium]|nr:MFS transporter [Acidimicrobiales bacterium]
MCTFVTLGLPDGMIGTAWPVLRHSFGVPLADLGLFLLVGTLGALASALVAGVLLSRAGYRLTLMLGATFGALGAAGIALSPAFWAFVASGAAIGLAAGLFDSSVNTVIALSGRNRVLNVLHGGYGVGTSIGPLMVTAALLASSWRASYTALVVIELAVLAGWSLLERRRKEPVPSPAEEHPPPRPPPAATPPASRGRLVYLVGLGLVVFMVYVGLEAGAGQWGPSFDRGPLHLDAGATGLATFGYWGALTLFRFALAVPKRPPPPAAIVRWGCVTALGAAGVVWWRPADIVALLALAVLGAALAGVFPALVALTPARVGDEISHHVIGWQIGAAGLGGSIISAIFGLVFQRYGLGEYGPALFCVAVVLLAGVIALERAAPSRLAGLARSNAQ